MAHLNEILNWILLCPVCAALSLKAPHVFQTADERRRIKRKLIITYAPQLRESFN